MVIPVNLGEKSYDIFLEKGGLSKVGQFFDLDRNVMIVTDSKVPPHYVGAVHKACKRACVITIEAGEESKTLETFSAIAFISTGNSILPPQKLNMIPYFKNIN